MTRTPLAMLLSVFVYLLTACTEEPPTIHPCDRVAADPEDPNATTSGIPDQDLDSAGVLDLCKTAADKYPETPRFQYQYARALLKLQRPSDAVAPLERAAELGHRRSMAKLGDLYSGGYTQIDADLERSREYYLQAHRLGDPYASYALGNLHRNTNGDNTNSLQYFEEAVNRGVEKAKDSICNIYYDKFSAETAKTIGLSWDSHVIGLSWCRDAASQDSSQSANRYHQYGYGLLDMARESEVSVDLQQSLVKEHPDIVHARNEDGKTLLSLASFGTSNYYSDLVEMLIVAGADSNLKTKSGLTPLHFAAGACWMEALATKLKEEAMSKEACAPIFTLVNMGADLGTKDSDGDTPIDKLETISDGTNATPLVYAIGRTDDRLSEILLTLGADPNENVKGFSPLMLASYQGDREIVQLLLSHGANTSYRGIDGTTAAKIASSQGHRDIERLIRGGAVTESRQTNGDVKVEIDVQVPERGVHDTSFEVQFFPLNDTAQKHGAFSGRINLGTPFFDRIFGSEMISGEEIFFYIPIGSRWRAELPNHSLDFEVTHDFHVIQDGPKEVSVWP